MRRLKTRKASTPARPTPPRQMADTMAEMFANTLTRNLPSGVTEGWQRDARTKNSNLLSIALVRAHTVGGNNQPYAVDIAATFTPVPQGIAVLVIALWNRDTGTKRQYYKYSGTEDTVIIAEIDEGEPLSMAAELALDTAGYISTYASNIGNPNK